MTLDLAAHFRHMARNNAWSNHRLYGAVARLSEAEYRATRVSFFPTIPMTLSHILIVDWYYIDALAEEGRGYDVFVADEPYAGFAELAAAQQASDRKLMAFCDRLTPGDLERKVILDRRERGRFPETIPDVLGHLFTHQIHHRGQVHAMLSGTSVEPPQLDEFFLAEDLRRRRDELRALALPEA